MMYHKFINDREVFSDGKTLHTEDGWISNPTQEMMEQNGWEIYVPPVVPPTPQTEPGMDDIIQAVKKMLSTDTEQLSDEDALAVAAVFPTWVSKMGEEVTAGERFWYDGFLWKVLQPHTVQDNWTPSTSPSLYVKVSIEEIPDWVQPTGAQDAYMTGDKVRYQGEVYESTVDNNTWAPDVYGWIKL